MQLLQRPAPLQAVCYKALTRLTLNRSSGHCWHKCVSESCACCCRQALDGISNAFDSCTRFAFAVESMHQQMGGTIEKEKRYLRIAGVCLSLSVEGVRLCCS
jgi:hypothetical protein